MAIAGVKSSGLDVSVIVNRKSIVIARENAIGQGAIRRIDGNTHGRVFSLQPSYLINGEG